MERNVSNYQENKTKSSDYDKISTEKIIQKIINILYGG